MHPSHLLNWGDPTTHKGTGSVLGQPHTTQHKGVIFSFFITIGSPSRRGPKDTPPDDTGSVEVDEGWVTHLHTTLNKSRDEKLFDTPRLGIEPNLTRGIPKINEGIDQD